MTRERALALLGVCGLALSGCMVERKALFAGPPGPLQLAHELQQQPLQRSWAIGEIFVSADRHGGPQQLAENWAPARAQVEQRLGEMLRSQPALGRRVEDRQSAELVVDVDVMLRESRGLNGWIAPAILSEVVILGVGAGGGAGIGAAVGGSNRAGSAATGALIGTAISIVPAVLVPLFFPANDVVGSADAKLTFRRASDGVPVYEKQVRAEWVDQHNSFSSEEKLARITGAGIEQLERQVVTGVHAGLRLAPAIQPAQVVLQGSLGPLASDAPRRARLVP